MEAFIAQLPILTLIVDNVVHFFNWHVARLIVRIHFTLVVYLSGLYLTLHDYFLYDQIHKLLYFILGAATI